MLPEVQPCRAACVCPAAQCTGIGAGGWVFEDLPLSPCEAVLFSNKTSRLGKLEKASPELAAVPPSCGCRTAGEGINQLKNLR